MTSRKVSRIYTHPRFADAGTQLPVNETARSVGLATPLNDTSYVRSATGRALPSRRTP